MLELPAEVAPANSFVLLASIIHAHLGELFAGRRVVGYSQFRVTRDADLWFDEEEVKNLRQALEGELPQRQFGLAVRLEVAASCAPPLAQLLLQQFELEEADLYRCDGPVNLARLTRLVDESDRTELKYPPFVPGTPDRFATSPTSWPRSGSTTSCCIIRISRSIRWSSSSARPARRPRRGGNQADRLSNRRQFDTDGRAGRGRAPRKEVTVVVELLARFDEEANINWAERLEEAGAQVVYGVFGLKPTPSSRCCCAASSMRSAALGCGRMPTWAPETITRAPRGYTPTSACSP